MSNSVRELNARQAFQTHCLAQMGVVTWLSGSQTAMGSVYFDAQPWQAHGEMSFDSMSTPAVQAKMPDMRAGFAERVETPIVKLPPQEKQESVSHLRQQLNAAPEIIVEDLQPIEERAVDIDPQPETAVTQITQLNVYAFALAEKLLIISDVPILFTQQGEIEHLALKMAQALLKHPADNWQSYHLSWPGELKNPHFIMRTDWLLGLLESSVKRWTQSFVSDVWLVVAGANIAQLIDDLPADSPLKSYPTARIVSLSELHRIPELRKEAWQTMQTSFFSSR
ncbi:hypothetical protein [Marinomonas sp. THO17]|uniref:hypothetical protein n=1 Tax=Marinomonas sp. THO17 TaxID=3149048 RepID=UPI00336BFF1D